MNADNLDNYWKETASCYHGNEPSGSVIGREFLEHLKEDQLLKENSSPWSLARRESTGEPSSPRRLRQLQTT
jgi:hypothetical protein